MRCIIIDNDWEASENLERNIHRVEFLKLLRAFANVIEAINFIYANDVDLIFLNADMPEASDILQVQDYNRNCSFILTGQSIKCVSEKLDLDTTDYLIKPVSFERFLKAIIKTIQIKSLGKDSESSLKKEKPLFIKNGITLYKLDLPNILFLKKEGNYFNIHLKGNKKVLIRMNFLKVFSYIPIDKFIRIHKSFIVNVDQIDLIRGQNIVIDSHEIPIGLSYKDDVMKHLKVI